MNLITDVLRCVSCDVRPIDGTCPFCGKAMCNGCGRFHHCLNEADRCPDCGGAGGIDEPCDVCGRIAACPPGASR